MAKFIILKNGNNQELYPVTHKSVIIGYEEQVQPDWEQDDNTAKDYIKNKPNFDAQEQSDWNEDDSSKASYIKNKPTVGHIIVTIANSAGTLSQEDFDLLSGNNCIVLYGNNYYYKSYESSIDIEYRRLDSVKTVNQISDYYLNITKSNRGYTFSSNVDTRKKVEPNAATEPGTAAILNTLVIGDQEFIIPSSGSGITDAPSDGEQYVRKDGAWVKLDTVPIVNSLIKINLNTDTGASLPNGITVSVKKSSDDSILHTLTWQGSELECYVPGGENFYVVYGAATNFKAPANSVHSAVAGLTQNVLATYKYNVPGVYIRYTDGTLSAYNSLTNGKTPLAVALITANVRLMIHNDEAELFWGQNYVNNSFNPIVADGNLDFAGKAKTQALIEGNFGVNDTLHCAGWAASRTFIDGSHGYLPAAGELKEIFDNFANINTALGLLNGTALKSKNISDPTTDFPYYYGSSSESDAYNTIAQNGIWCLDRTKTLGSQVYSVSLTKVCTYDDINDEDAKFYTRSVIDF